MVTKLNISIHALREEGDYAAEGIRAHEMCISIHALREEGDPVFLSMAYSYSISIHALREEGDLFQPD